MEVILALRKGRSSSQMVPIYREASACVLASFGIAKNGTGQTFPPPILVSNKVGVGACPLEKATRTDSSANISAAQSESESSSREAALLVRCQRTAWVRSRISSARWGCAGTSPAVWDGASGASGRPPSGLERPSAPQDRGMSFNVNVYDKILLLDNPRLQAPQACVQETPQFGQNAASSQHSVFSGGRQCSSPQHATHGSRNSVRLCSTSYGPSESYEASTAFSDVTGMQQKSRWGRFRGPRRYEKAARIAQLLQAASSQDLRWPKVHRHRLAQLLSAPCGTVSRAATEEMILLLGSGAALWLGNGNALSRVLRSGASRKCIKLWRRQLCSATSQACYGRAKLVASYSTSMVKISPTCSTASCLCSLPVGSGPPAQCPRDHRAHEFLREA